LASTHGLLYVETNAIGDQNVAEVFEQLLELVYARQKFVIHEEPSQYE
jgi:hypothetical protein